MDASRDGPVESLLLLLTTTTTLIDRTIESSNPRESVCVHAGADSGALVILWY